MSFDLADWSSCDEHLTTFLNDEPCPKCTDGVVVKSVVDFTRLYLPEQYRRDQEAGMTPEELGHKWANESLEKHKHILLRDS
jgi:hypothetical protein